MKEKTISEQFEEIKKEMCDKYCKWPERYLAEIECPDEAQEVMIEEKCKDCPLNKLV